MEEGYPEGGYPAGGYPVGGYPNGGHPDGGYPEGEWPCKMFEKNPLSLSSTSCRPLFPPLILPCLANREISGKESDP